MTSLNDRVLVISDAHFPHNHPDIIAFLEALKKHIKPTRVISVGDEVDFNAISFHEKDPDLLSPSDELKSAIEKLQPLYKMFPKMDILESNHGSLVYRKGRFAGLPRHVFKSYREILEAPIGWNWHFDLTLDLPTKQKVYFHHGKSSNGLKLSQAYGMNCVQGHFHSKFCIDYWGNPEKLSWSMQVGCLVDSHSLAMAYAKNTMQRPVIGTGSIIGGFPKLWPMILDNNGRWIKRLV